MVAAATTLPPLPAPDEAILTRLFETDAPSLTDLFKSLSQSRIDGAPQSLLDLGRWSQRPEIKTWLDFHAAELAAAIRRRRIAKLEQIADTTKDLVEQRRACTTALRALDRATTARPARNNQDGTTLRGVHWPSSPTGGGGRAAAGGGSVPTSSTDAPFTARVPSHSTPTKPAASLPASSPSHAAPSDSPSRGAATVPCPGRKPWESPPNNKAPEGRHSASLDDTTPCDHASPDFLLDLAVSHSQTPRDPASIAALAGALAPSATINHTPVDNHNPQLALATLPIPPSTLTAIDPPLIESADDTFSWSAHFTYECGVRSRFHLALTRSGTRWQIATLNHHFNSIEPPPSSDKTSPGPASRSDPPTHPLSGPPFSTNRR